MKRSHLPMEHVFPITTRAAKMLFFLGGIWLPMVGNAQDNDRDREIERLKQIVLALEARITALEAAATTTAGAPTNVTEPRSLPERLPDDVTGVDGISASGAERIDEAESLPPRSETEDQIAFKGALRYNVFFNDENDGTKRGDSGFDLFRVGAEGSREDVLISAEYRFYSFMDTLHHGWIGYDLRETGQFQLGVSQVPFGILPYASHNFWFGAPYYLGLSDDYDLGLKFVRQSGPWEYQLAFYKNAELGAASNLNRYSFDVVHAGADQRNEETNQFNVRVAHAFGRGTDSVHQVGFSGQAGQLYNAITEDMGNHWAVATHLDSRFDRWNIQLELARYEYNPKNPPGVSDETVTLGAFGTSYVIDASATVGVANVAYNVPVQIPGIDQLLLYNDFSIVWKDSAAFEDSILNTTGAGLGIGPLFLYLDLIQARNMVFFGGGSLAGDGDTSWRSRLNLNVGYYW